MDRLTVWRDSIISTVTQVGLFVTTIKGTGTVLNYVGNNKILSGNIQNFSAYPHVVIDLTAQFPPGIDLRAAIEQLRKRLARIPNVLADPGPVIDIKSVTPLGPTLSVQPACHGRHYMQVSSDANWAIYEVLASYPAAGQYHVARNVA